MADKKQYQPESIVSNALGVNIDIPKDAENLGLTMAKGAFANLLTQNHLPTDTRGMAQLFETELVTAISADIKPVFGNDASLAFTKLINDYFSLKLPTIPEVQF